MLLIVTMLISLSTFSQTTKDSVTISVVQAKKIAKDLAYLPILTQENNILKDDTTRFKFVISQMDSQLLIKNQEINILDTVVKNQKAQIDLGIKQQEATVSETKWLKIERIGLAAILLLVSGYAIGKP